jgi:hypothetical protein
MFALSIGSPPASRVEISWNTETQVFDAVLVVKKLTVMPDCLVNFCSSFWVAGNVFEVPGKPRVSTSSPVDVADEAPELELEQAASIGPAIDAAAAVLRPVERKSRRLGPG